MHISKPLYQLPASVAEMQGGQDIIHINVELKQARQSAPTPMLLVNAVQAQ